VAKNSKQLHDFREGSDGNRYLHILKLAILQWRRFRIRQLQQMKRTATDLAILARLDKEIEHADIFRNEKWFIETTPAKMPRLTDFVTMQRAQDILQKQSQPPDKTYDNKFGILSPPSSVAPELAYWREQCDLREVGLALAYFDIDNFKQNFNTPYTEKVIDRNCLPVIMRRIDSHVFKHGSAFHEGGDEFVILLPNVEKDYAITFMAKLRTDMPKLEFPAIQARATISIGICHVAPDSFLTDDEIQQKANDAKKYAKDNGGKNCIVTHDGNDYHQDQLKVVKSG